MGAAEVFVSVVVSIAGGSSPTRQGFGTMLLAAYHTKWLERVHFYSASSALATLVTEGFATVHPVYRAFEVALSQDPAPKLLALGRRSAPFTQTLAIQLTDTTADVLYAITVVGSDGIGHVYSFASTGVPGDDAAMLAGLMIDANIGTATATTNTVTLTQAPGLLSDLRDWTPGIMRPKNVTASPAGFGADLAAIKAANSLSWYGLALDSNSAAEVATAAAFIEATGQGGHVGFFDSADYRDVDGGATDDIFTTVEGLGYKRSHFQHSGRRVLSYMGLGLGAQLLAYDPGSYSAAFKTIAGVPADTDQTLTETMRVVLNTASTSQPGTGGKNGNWYKTVSGVNVTFPGTTPKPQWMDVIIFTDWLQSNAQVDLFAYMTGLPKVPMTQFGLEGLGAVLKSRMVTGAKPPFNGLVLESIVVNVPKIGDIPLPDRQARNVTGLTASANLTGGINTVSVLITVTP